MAGALVLAILAGAAVFGLSRLGNNKTAAKSVAPPVSASLIELAGPMPSWLASANQVIRDDYTWAASHHNELQYFPCFCGCYQSAGHVSNSACYFDRGADKRIAAYDSHAVG
ncbi:MAG TPA: PCYCGC motif-containing (lipo)protein [Symbiobacteriaceae bacterium]|nr:PCYCGC motif-containing (lipo)protein [Symbiobacteriaceae bacterium]